MSVKLVDRKIGERLVIGGNIIITMWKIKAVKNRDPVATLHVDVPDHLLIHETKKAAEDD